MNRLILFIIGYSFLFSFSYSQIRNIEIGEIIQKTDSITINPGTGLIHQQREHNAGDIPDKTSVLDSIKSDIQSVRLKRNISIGISVAGFIIGVIQKFAADAAYKEYKTATTEAPDLRRTIELYDKTYPVALGIGAVGIVNTYKYHKKLMTLKWKLNQELKNEYP